MLQHEWAPRFKLIGDVLNRLETATQSTTCPLAANNDVDGIVRLPVKILNQSYSQFLPNYFICESAINDKTALRSHWAGSRLPDPGVGTHSDKRRTVASIHKSGFDPTKCLMILGVPQKWLKERIPDKRRLNK